VQKQRLPPANTAPQWQRQQQAGASASHALGQEVYRVALTTAFLLQAVAAGFVPYIGAEHVMLAAASDWCPTSALVCMNTVVTSAALTLRRQGAGACDAVVAVRAVLLRLQVRVSQAPCVFLHSCSPKVCNFGMNVLMSD
jgi:hypothetical protein